MHFTSLLRLLLTGAFNVIVWQRRRRIGMNFLMLPSIYSFEVNAAKWQQLLP
jgi:hypothetical protein